VIVTPRPLPSISIQKLLLNATYGKFATSYGSAPYVAPPRPTLAQLFQGCQQAYNELLLARLNGDESEHVVVRALTRSYAKLVFELGFQIHQLTCKVCKPGDPNCHHGYHLDYVGQDLDARRFWLTVQEDDFNNRLCRMATRLAALQRPSC
jgi:hypothetical protein